MKAIIFIAVVMALGLVSVVAIITPDFAYSAKNPQAECIKGQNQGFIGNEQKGDAY
jgi:hypothetical protein